jgi:hypothetical protein
MYGFLLREDDGVFVVVFESAFGVDVGEVFGRSGEERIRGKAFIGLKHSQDVPSWAFGIRPSPESCGIPSDSLRGDLGCNIRYIGFSNIDCLS